MKKFIVFAVICVIAFVYLPATAVSQKSYKLTMGTISKYVPLVGLLPYDSKPVFQASYETQLPANFYAKVWASTGFNTTANFGKEIDWTAGYAYTINDNDKYEVSLSYFDLNKQFTTVGEIGDVISPMLKYSVTVQTIESGEKKATPFIEVYYFYVTKETKNNSSFLIRYGVDFDSGPISYGNLIVGGALVYDGGIFGRQNEGFMGDFHLEYPFPSGGLARMTPTLRLNLPFKNVEGKSAQFTFGFRLDI